jgi:hypothetical protein
LRRQTTLSPCAQVCLCLCYTNLPRFVRPRRGTEANLGEGARRGKSMRSTPGPRFARPSVFATQTWAEGSLLRKPGRRGACEARCVAERACFAPLLTPLGRGARNEQICSLRFCLCYVCPPSGPLFASQPLLLCSFFARTLLRKPLLPTPRFDQVCVAKTDDSVFATQTWA